MRHITPQLCAQLFCISLFLIFNSHSAAQVRREPGIRYEIPNPDRTLVNPRRELQPEINIERQARILLAALKEDFRQLQVVNNELMERTVLESRHNPERITSKEIRSSLSEIQKRARRLRTNLRLPEVETRKDDINKDGLSGFSLSSGLIMLDQTVTKFVENPVFQKPGVFDAHDSLRAAEDVNKILRLTESLCRLAKEDPAPVVNRDSKN